MENGERSKTICKDDNEISMFIQYKFINVYKGIFVCSFSFAKFNELL
jgi:hypothetical protein